MIQNQKNQEGSLFIKQDDQPTPNQTKNNFEVLSLTYTKTDTVIGWVGAIIWVILQINYMFKSMKIVSEEKVVGISDSYFGFKKDTSDLQWNAYSENIHLLLLVAVIFVTGSNLIKSYKPVKIDSYKKPLFYYYIIFGLGYLTYLFETGIVFWLLITSINYLIIQFTYKKRIFPPIIWIFNLATLYFNEVHHGYDFKNLFPFLPLSLTQELQNIRNHAPVQWHYVFNMTILRMISFGFDKHWAYNKTKIQTKSEHQMKCTVCVKNIKCLKIHQEHHHVSEDYNLLHFYSYLAYVPLFITGPPLTFNAFLSQVFQPQNVFSKSAKIIYSLRTLVVYLTFQIWIHFCHSFAFSTKPENQQIWHLFSIGELYMMCVTTLVFLWLKFNTIWKIARCWALWDDIEAPENMNRCIHNNHCFEEFWRSWHRGFNQWLIRYIYIPLGGNKTKKWNIWVIFTFVALWHDMNINLVLWAWGICLCLVPEIVAKKHFQNQKYKWLWKKRWWIFVCGAVGAFWIVFLCITNLIGFGPGYQILKFFAEKFFTTFEGTSDLIFGEIILIGLCLRQYQIRTNDNAEQKGM